MGAYNNQFERAADGRHPTQNGNKTAFDVTYGSGEETWWICPKSALHDYEYPVSVRTRGYNCPFCHGSRVAPDTCLEYVYPNLAKEWHRTKNEDLTPDQVPANYSKKVHWFCPIHPDKKWHVSPNQRRGGDRGCPHCANKTSKIEIRIYTELKTIFEDATWPGEKVSGEFIDVLLPSLRIGIEYDSKYHHLNREKQDQRKNKVLESCDYCLINLREEGLPLFGKYDVEVPVDGSHRTVIQLLLSKLSDLVPKEEQEKIQTYLSRNKFVNDEEYRAELAKLSSKPIGETLPAKHPEIAKFWDYDENFPLKPEFFGPSSVRKVWWKCERKDYHPSFERKINHRVLSSACDYCQGKKVHRRDSLAVLYPELLKDWDYEKNTFKPEKVWPKWQENRYRAFWTCSECGHPWRSAPINRCGRKKSGCPQRRRHG